jgi:DNA-binding beta-propeller fold protein YncE
MGSMMIDSPMYTLAKLSFVGSIALAVIVLPAPAWGAPLELEATISLGQVQGRIDHLAVDVTRQRLYIAELGNDTVGVVDLEHHTVLRTLTGLREPQGLGYEPSTDTLYVANAGDGAVQLFEGADLKPAGRIELGKDADNIRIDSNTHRVIVGYGSGALAVIDPVSRKKVADIKLKGHPESFQLEPDGGQAFVNVPDAHEIAAVNFAQGKQTASWAPGLLLSNYPMSLDQAGKRIHVVFRHPATLAAFDTQSGKKLYSIETCTDSDDVFVDSKRSRVYVSCGAGFIEVVADKGTSYAKVARITTVGGARTSLYVPQLDRVFLAVRANGPAPAAVWIFKPGQ